MILDYMRIYSKNNNDIIKYIMNNNTSTIDYLPEDKPFSGAKYFSISLATPEGIMNCNTRAIKVRGAYQTMDEAKKHVETLRSVDPSCDILVGDIGKWIGWNPDISNPNIKKEYGSEQKELNDLMKAHDENNAKAAMHQRQRKINIKRRPQKPVTDIGDIKKQAIRKRLNQKALQKSTTSSIDTSELIKKDVDQSKDVDLDSHIETTKKMYKDLMF